MKVSKSDNELLTLIHKGDRVAFYQIYERYCKRLYVFVYSYTKLKEDTEEIVQEVFIKIWEKRGTINTDSSFGAFIFTIAYNATINLLKKKVNERKYLDYIKSLNQIKDAPDVIDEIYFNELNKKVKELLNKLTPRQKEIYLLSREKGLTHEEIAKNLGISLNTVKKHMVNTLAFLKSNLDSSLVANLLFICLFL